MYDAVTRHPGGRFEEVMRGFAYLREAGAGFTVQLIPMRANWHQWDRMVALAKSLSPHYRIGATWLFLSSDGLARKNREIAGQRLAPRDIIALDEPNLTNIERMQEIRAGEEWCEHAGAVSANVDDRLFAGCIASRRDFHIDAYGKMTFCSFIKNPALRYDLRRGAFREAWDEFIPSLADKVRGGDEYRANCGACERARTPAAGARLIVIWRASVIPRLSAIFAQSPRRRRNSRWNGRINIADIFRSPALPCVWKAIWISTRSNSRRNSSPSRWRARARTTWRNVASLFRTARFKGKDLGEELYRKVPWAISRKNGTWFYLGIAPDGER